ncbi:MAG: bifunctional glutathionylspermidine amidase/synthase [Burkholderiaceae bacterium]|jgi:glutathionylspermidine amidase/synthetase|nr:bifunctional glutathionylspermidine amidase/synthase [Burkholderiaceae bacterium]
MSAQQGSPHEPFGTLLGHAPGGVAIYSSDYASADPQQYPDDASFRSHIGRECLGYKWQCVEFVRRFLYLNHGYVFTDVGKAYEIFSLRFVRRVINDAILPLQAFANGGPRAPAPGALLIWQEGGEFKGTGHVAVITEVLADKVRIAEQNVLHTRLPAGQQWTRELPLHATPEGYAIEDTFDDTRILGWMIQTLDATHSLPAPRTPAHLLQIHAARLPERGQFAGPWLDERDPVQAAYVAARGHSIHRDDPYRYFTITEQAEQELVRATNELHLMYLHATDKVLKDDALLARFNVPEILWPRLRLSWHERRHQTIAARMDFCMDARGLKVYEYNADSASCHTEAGLILRQWAQQGGLSEGADPARGLLNALIDSWKHSDALPFVHILQDNDSEENYHALFMQRALTRAGFGTRILRGLDALRWDRRGRLMDDQDRQVDCVWKTWAWETALQQLRKECEEEHLAALPVRTGTHPGGGKVRLMDVLLRPEVKVFEPLWTVIPSNKAILPVLCSLGIPRSRHLLDASFELTEPLAREGYAIKPIAGRCGNNIELVDNREQTLDKTTGNFSGQNNIYQQLWCLPNVDGRHVQICAFTVGGRYGGACLRADPSLVITGDSDMQPLRVIPAPQNRQ